MTDQKVSHKPSVARVLVAGCIISASLAVVCAFLLASANRPKVAFEFPYRGYSVDFMRFSSDGHTLAVATNETRFGGAQEIDWTRVYHVPDGLVMHEFENAGHICAWNRDGSTLAIARPNGEQFDLWDSKTWVRKSTLSIGFLAGDKMLKAYLGTRVCQLCFDRQGNLYAALSVNTDMGGNIPPFDRARVWWNASDGEGVIKGDQIGSFPFALDLSTASLGPDIRVALSCMDPESPVEILRVRKRAGEKPIVRRDYALSDLGTLKSDSILPSLCLTVDGTYLVVRTLERWRLFRLFDDHAQMLYSREDRIDSATMAPRLGSVPDVSFDGRVATDVSVNGMRIVRMSDGESILEVPLEKYCHFALSPDGTLLAIEDRLQKRVCFFRVPKIE